MDSSTDIRQTETVAHAAIRPVTVIEPAKGVWSLGLHELWEFRHLARYLISREMRGRYRATALGRAWLLIRPVFEMLIYVLIFGVLLNLQRGDIPFPLYVYSGLVIWLFFAGSVNKAAASLAGNRHMMTKVYFPRMVTPLVAIGGEFLNLAFASTVVVVLMLYYGIFPGAEIVALPFMVILLILFTISLSLFLAAISVHFSDVNIALPVVMRAWMYLTPVIYPIEFVPEDWRWLFFLNPMAVIVQGLRWSIMGAAPPPLPHLALVVLLTAVGLVAAAYKFRRTERTMVDYL